MQCKSLRCQLCMLSTLLFSKDISKEEVSEVYLLLKQPFHENVNEFKSYKEFQ